MTLDGDASTIATMEALPGVGSAFNFTLYNVQSLTAGDHMLDVALSDYVYSNGTTKGSMIRFDAAAVNETSPVVVAPSASSSDAGAVTPTSNVPASTSHSA